MPFHALPNPNMIWQSIEGHALPDATILYSSVWKGMPFYALPYHIGVWKGMEGHKKGNGYKLEEGRDSNNLQNDVKGIVRHFFSIVQMSYFEY